MRYRKVDDKLFGEDGFSAALLVQCAYQFVWHELAWNYYQAYGTTSPFVIEYRDDNEYKPTCGAVILCP
ncbi:hypothetical protein AAVH_23260 [Aphelenchoides avenae]|nr:hypothetical protein AAVH_23260 [Aphelenchus avenae]